MEIERGTNSGTSMFCGESRETVDDGLIGTDDKSGDELSKLKSDVLDVESYQTPWLIKVVMSLNNST